MSAVSSSLSFRFSRPIVWLFSAFFLCLGLSELGKKDDDSDSDLTFSFRENNSEKIPYNHKMKLSFMLKKTPVVFIVLLCFVLSFTLVEARRSIRVRKVRTQVAPKHISLSARTGNGLYARTFAYGRPMPKYSTKGKMGKNRRYYSERGRSYGKREYLARTYANKYRNWSPHARKSPRADKIGQVKRRKELVPFLVEPPYGANKHKRRIRPQRPSPMQRPKPPKKPNREQFEDEYFFPEEAKRGEAKYELESRYPRPKKKRRPEVESYYKPASLASKIPYYDEKPLAYKPKPREPPFSYSSFVHHPSASDDPEDFYEDSDSMYSQPLTRTKKKRLKKKSNSRKKNKPIVFESDSAAQNYPPYLSSDDYDLPTKTYKKRNKPTYDSNSDDQFLPTKTHTQPHLQANNLFSTDTDYNRNNPDTHFSPSYSPTWSHQTRLQTTPRPLQQQTETGFQPHHYVPPHYNYNNDYSTLQQTKTPATNTHHSTYYSSPDNAYKTLAHSANTNSNHPALPQASANYNAYSGNYNQVSSAYSQPLPASPSLLADVTIQKSVPIYDNTETFYNFNNNAYVSSQSSKYYNSEADTSHKYGVRSSTGAVPARNKVGEKTDSDSEFLKKHQNLYNKGLSGVPVQGDGFAKESGKKDYDIGYGDFQFDENPST